MLMTEYVEAMDALMDTEDIRICAYCDTATTRAFCDECGEYKGLISISEWETMTGEVWE